MLEQELTPGEQNNIAEDLSFKKTIEESKIKIQEAHLEQAPKRGRGRPRKHPEANPTTSKESFTEPTSIIAKSTEPPPDLAPLIKGPLIFISKIPASKHNIPELALSPDEAQMCAESLNQILNAFVPDVGNMDPKTAAVVGGVTVFGSVFFQKYTLYLDKKKTLSPEPPQEMQEVVAEIQKTAGVDASSYFSR